jgi:pimeloyl-ACP methyl ester carboxylesterase
MEEIRLSEGTLRYRDEGPRKGETLVFLHGLLVNGRLWDPVVERLSGSHRCVVPELPLGSHLVPMDEGSDVTPLGVVKIVADLLEALELERVTLVGNDSGGAISQLVATRHPERLGRLVLTNCDAFDTFPPKLFAYLKLAARVPGAMAVLSQSMRLRPLRRAPIAYGVLTKSKLDAELLEAWVRPGIDDPAVRRDSAAFLRGSDPALTMQAARDLEAFGAPTLFAWAPEDRWFKVEHADRLAAAMPDARVQRIADSKTFVSIDQPEALADAIGAFLAETKPVAAAA